MGAMSATGRAAADRTAQATAVGLLVGVAALALGCAEIADPGDLGVDAGPTVHGDGMRPADGGPLDADAAPAPDAAPCTAGKVQLLGNPAFDEGVVTWVETSGPLIFPDAQIPINVHSTDYAVWLGRSGAAEQTLAQPIDIPVGTTALTLSLYTCFVTADTADSTDDVKVELVDGAGATVESLARYTLADAALTCNFALRTVTAAAPHAGESVQLAFKAHSDNGGLTSFYFDTLALEADVSCP
jgi:hypothetical protein